VSHARILGLDSIDQGVNEFAFDAILAIVGEPSLQVAERSIIIIVAAVVAAGAITAIVVTTIYFAFLDIEEDANDGTRNLFLWIGL